MGRLGGSGWDRTVKVLALVPGVNKLNPGQRFRIEQWEPFLRAEGVEILYSAFTSDTLGRLLYQPGHHARKGALMAAGYLKQLGAVVKARRADVVYVFREATLLGPAVIEPLIAWQGIPVVFDFDDAIFVPYVSPSNGYLSYLKCFGKTARLCRSAREVMVGNDYLKNYAERYNPAVTLVPTSIDTDRYRPEQRRPARDAVPRIGWTGSHSTLQHLRTVAPALARLAQHHRFRLVVIGTEPVVMPGVDVEFRPWRAETEVFDLADFDVGIMPLPEDPWSLGKCGLKALQYMALGIPPVVSPVGVNTEIVANERNGLWAGNDQEWFEQLARLINDRSLAAELGEAARATVLERYSARGTALRVASVFERARA